MSIKVELGQTYEDEPTKIVGVATAWTRFICGRISIKLEYVDKDNEPKSVWFSAWRLTQVQPKQFNGFTSKRTAENAPE